MNEANTTCRRIADRIARGQAPDDPVDLEHARGCEECSSRLGAIELLTTARDDAAGDFAEVQSLIAREGRVIGWLRSRSRGARLALLAIVGAAIAGSQLANLRADFGAYPLARMALAAVLPALAALYAWYAGLRPLHRAPPRRGAFVGLVVAIVGVPLLLAALPEASTGHAASHGGLGDELLPRAWACFAYGSVLALPALLLGALLDRDALRQPLAFLAAIGAPAVVANLALQLHCPLTHPAHLLLGHAAISVAFVLLGSVIWLMRTRAR